MAYLRIPKNPPDRIKRTAELFAQACIDEGWFGFTNLQCYGGEVTTAWNGNTRFENAEGEWFEIFKKEA